ncbi:MAG: DUF4167 domain-containing protein [Sphingomonas sp.]|nr:DUF4167 domain-containing protein [Sphingomonas sp.]
MINNRQAGRRRGRGGQRTPGGNPGRPDNGNRIDNRARGNAAQLLEKYKSLARDAQMQGDRVNTEYYLQFADHYFRVLNENRSRFEENQQRRGGANEAFDEDPEEEFDGESYADDRVDGERGQQANGNRRDANGRDAGNRDNGNNGHRDNGNRDGGNRDQSEGYREQGARDQNGRDQQRPPRDDYRNQPREQNRPRNEPRDYNGQQSVDQPRRASPVRDFDPADQPELVPVADALPAAIEPERPRRGRPRRIVPVETVADVAAIEADRLPPALSLSATIDEPTAEGEAEVKPRRRRGRPPASEVTPTT